MSRREEGDQQRQQQEQQQILEFILGLPLKYMPYGVRVLYSGLDKDTALLNQGMMTLAYKLGLCLPQSQSFRNRENPTMELIEYLSRTSNMYIRTWQNALNEMGSADAGFLKEPYVQRAILAEYHKQRARLVQLNEEPLWNPEPVQNSCSCCRPPPYRSSSSLSPGDISILNLAQPPMIITTGTPNRPSVEWVRQECYQDTHSLDEDETFPKAPFVSGTQVEQCFSDTDRDTQETSGTSNFNDNARYSWPPVSCVGRDCVYQRSGAKANTQKLCASSDISRHSSSESSLNSAQLKLRYERLRPIDPALSQQTAPSRGPRRTVLFTYGAHSADHLREVIGLIRSVQEDGNDVIVDMDKTGIQQNYPNDPNWLDTSYNRADYIVICISPTYLRDLSSGANPSLLNSRYLFELMRAEYIKNMSKNTKMIPVLFVNSSAVSARSVPTCMSSTRIYNYPTDLRQICTFIKEHTK